MIRGFPQIWASEFFEIAEFQYFKVAPIKILPERFEYHVMDSLLGKYTSEGMVVHVLINYFRATRISQTFQTLLHIIPLKLNATRVDESEFFMHVSCNMADPIVIESILSKFGSTFLNVDIGGVAVAEDHTTWRCVLFNHFDKKLMCFITHVIHYRNSSPSTEHAEDPPQLRKMAHIAPSLLSNKSLVYINL